jgi:hypothetical protein
MYMPVQLLQRGKFVNCKIVINCIIFVFEPGIWQCSCFSEDRSALVSSFCCVSGRERARFLSGHPASV